MSKPNIRTVNRMIQAKFPEYSVVQGKGYVYIVGPDTDEWTATAIYTPRVSDFAPEWWVREVEIAIRDCGTHG